MTTGCTAAVNDDVKRGWLPPASEGATTTTALSQNLWVGSWIAALVVGVITWGLIIYAIVRFRRRRGEAGLPPQLRYNVPVEMLFTIMPLFMVGVLFYFTARDQHILENRYEQPAVNIEVVGKRWAWDFNYTDANVYDAGIQAQETPNGLDLEAPGTIPTLYLPVNEKVELTLTSRDVIHDFYVPAFSYKKDVIPGRTNYMSVTPTKEGTFIGRCAELCGEGHSRMLFKVKVVSAEEYQQRLEELRAAGNVGELGPNIGPAHSLGEGSTAGNQQVEDQQGENAGGQNAQGSNG
ncbi:cytochrome c oxidase subunit II [Quadrisphaera sp. RL12-1S]|nr:cytochrome c oxidase subunit II [Quadrisphaera sp. RL12-1S]